MTVSVWGEIEMDPSCCALKGGASGPLTLLCFSWRGEVCQAEKFPLGAEQCRPARWDDAGKMKLFY